MELLNIKDNSFSIIEGYLLLDVKLLLLVPSRAVSNRAGANFTNRLELSHLSLCIRFKPKSRLKSVREIGPWGFSLKYSKSYTAFIFLRPSLFIYNHRQ